MLLALWQTKRFRLFLSCWISGEGCQEHLGFNMRMPLSTLSFPSGTMEVMDVLNQFLPVVKNWVCVNKLKLNPYRTKVLLVSKTFDSELGRQSRGPQWSTRGPLCSTCEAPKSNLNPGGDNCDKDHLCPHLAGAPAAVVTIESSLNFWTMLCVKQVFGNVVEASTGSKSLRCFGRLHHSHMLPTVLAPCMILGFFFPVCLSLF